MPAYAAAMWILYNAVIFGDPLAFQHGQFSAQADAQARHAATAGQPILSLLTYSWAVVDNLGWVVLGFAVAGLLLYLVTTRFRSEWWGVYALLSLFPFHVVLLYLGQTTIAVPQVPPTGIFNVRYALEMLPAAAILVGFLAARLGQIHRTLPILLMAGIVAAQVAMFVPSWPGNVINVAEAQQSVAKHPHQAQLVDFLRGQYTGGGILMDEAAQVFPTQAGIPLREYVVSANGSDWTDALSHPTQVAWVVMLNDPTQDRVAAALRGNAAFLQSFALVGTFDNVEVYKRTVAAAPATASH